MKIQTMRKEKIKLSDARVEYNRLIRQEARKESYADMVKRIICENVEPINIPVHYTLFNSSTDLLCHLTDIHCGIEIHNWKNDFDEDVLKKRIEKFTSDILDIRGMHESENCYLVIGEILSGIIHNNLRLQNNMDLMEQFKYVSELISAMLSRMANHFNHIYVYTTPGNHSRISPKKEDALDGENMDTLLPFYLKARMQNIKNITICDNTIEPEIAMFNIRGNNVFAAHGHKDNPSSVVQNFTLMFGIKPDIVLLGHRHTNGLTTVYDVKIEKHKKNKTLDQNAYAWKLMNEIGNVLRKSKDEVYFEMLKSYGQISEISMLSSIDPSGYFKYYDISSKRLFNNKEFTIYRIYKGISEYDTREMSIFIDGVIQEAKQLGIQTLTPNQLLELKSMEDSNDKSRNQRKTTKLQ